MIKTFFPQSVKFLENGEKSFNKRNECTGDKHKYCSIVAKGMTTSFQLEMLPTTGTQLLLNPNFQSDLSDWDVTNFIHSTDFGGSAEASPISSPGIPLLNPTLGQLATVTVGKYYYIEVKFREVSGNIVQGLPASSSVQVSTTSTGTGSKQHTGNRIARVWFRADSTSILILISLSKLGYVEYAKMYELTIPTIEVKDESGNVVLEPTVSFFENRAIVNINWNLIDDACGYYTICAFPDGDTTVNFVRCQNALIDGEGDLILDGEGNCI